MENFYCKIVLFVLITLMLFAICSCSVDTGESTQCERSLEMTGSVGGVDVFASDYSMQSVWFIRSYDEVVLSDLDQEQMQSLGLDPENNEDVDRYFYWVSAYDHRVLFVQELTTTSYGSLGGTIGKDFSIFFFDLETYQVQPDTEIDIFDISSIESIRDDKIQLGETIRSLIDQMRYNDKPDVIIGFSPDRSGEDEVQSALIILFSPNAQFATSGTAEFHSIINTSGENVNEIPYPYRDFDAMSLSANVTFQEGENVSVEASCLKVEVSDDSDE